ncbi:MerR family transcriptional regulator [Sanguibacter sp. 25GB23B1]|uniref:MerR family transcriptional regulator n=1 Tax=unclassified Sanguibacter TaxID=2645534 RepID=UPI0032B01CB2
MHSGELARLAGVTVRALRHYHQVGVLPEPERRSNGYRDYDVHDLVRVLRIKRLAALGIPLERMPELLDAASPDSGDLLAELDAELARQIERLTRQRSLVARLRDHDAPLDLPPELAPFAAALARAGLPADLARLDRDQAVLLAHLTGDDGMPSLARLYERLVEPGLVDAVAALSERFGRLGPGSTDADVAGLVEDFVTALAPVIADLSASEPAIDLAGSADILAQYTTAVLTEPQRRVLTQLEARLDGDGSP